MSITITTTIFIISISVEILFSFIFLFCYYVAHCGALRRTVAHCGALRRCVAHWRTVLAHCFGALWRTESRSFAASRGFSRLLAALLVFAEPRCLNYAYVVETRNYLTKDCGVESMPNLRPCWATYRSIARSLHPTRPTAAVNAENCLCRSFSLGRLEHQAVLVSTTAAAQPQ